MRRRGAEGGVARRNLNRNQMKRLPVLYHLRAWPRDSLSMDLDPRLRARPLTPSTPARPAVDTRPVGALAGPLPRPPAAAAGRAAAVDRLRAYAAAEKALPLQPGSETRLYLHPDPAPRGVLVMYHGFSAGTWQFDLLAKKAYAAGYDVVVPRLPGHGLKDAQGVEDPSQLPKAADWSRYQDFAEQTYQLARGLGGPLSVLGLSVGANVALDVAEHHPEIQRVVAYAPFLAPPGFAGKLISAVQALDKVTFGLAGRLLDFVPWGWGKESEAETASGKRPGHSKFPLGTIYAATQLGSRLIADGPKARAPIQFFVTDVDDAADNPTIRRLHDRAGGDPRNGWYRFTAAEGIPHPMVHPQEDRGKGHTPLLYAETMKFLLSGRPLDKNED